MIMHCRKLIHNPGLLKIASIVLGILLLILPIGCVGEAPSPVPPENNIIPSPVKVEVNQPVDPNKIAFGVITDTHILSSEDASTAVVSGLNKAGKNANILGVVHMGDMCSKGTDEKIFLFRQRYENDLPGAYRVAAPIIYFPVFPTVGNHDVKNSKNSVSTGDWVANYLGDRIRGATGITSYANDDVTYAWKWGNYHFLSLGLWAGAKGAAVMEETTDIDADRLKWVDNYLKTNVGDSGDGVFILQHYGWDEFSTEARWWSETMRQLELDILCRRYTGGTTTNSNGIANPYNILGIFTGHTHWEEIKEIPAGNDSNGKAVKFYNYVFPTSGTGQREMYKDKYLQYTGYSVITLDGTKMSIKYTETNIKTDTIKTHDYSTTYKLGKDWNK